MIINHQDNVAAFVGGHTYYWGFQPLFHSRISVTSVGVVILWTKVGTSFKYDANTLLTGDRATMLAIGESVVIGASVLSITEDATLTIADGLVLVDATSNNVTVTIPSASTQTNKKYCIKKIDSSAHTVTIDVADSGTIDEALEAVLTDQYEEVTPISDGTEYWIK